MSSIADTLIAAGWTRGTRSVVCGCRGPRTARCARPALWTRPGYEQPRCAPHALDVTEQQS